MSIDENMEYEHHEVRQPVVANTARSGRFGLSSQSAAQNLRQCGLHDAEPMSAATPRSDTTDLAVPAGWSKCADCPVCGSERLSSLCAARDHHYGNDGVWHYSRCGACGAAFMDPFPPAHALSAFYPRTYYSFRRFDSLKDRLKLLFRRLMGIPLGARDPTLPTPGTMLDLGCGSGAALKLFRDRGWTVHGVEISDQAARTGHEAYGLDIFVGTLDEARLPSERFDYVRANHALEHMTNPHETFAEVFRLLKPGGMLHIGVPNLNGIGARWFGSHWFLFCAPVHVFEYTPAALRELGERAGFEVRRVAYNSDYGSLLGSLQALANRRKIHRVASQGWIFRNPILVFLAQRIVDVFDLLGRGDVVEVTYAKPARKTTGTSGVSDPK